MTGRGKAFHAGNQPPFTMEAFFRPPWIYPLMAWIFTMFMWMPNLGPGAVKWRALSSRQHKVARSSAAST